MIPSLDFVKNLAIEAGKIILSQKPTLRGDKEGVGNIVTESDLNSEKHIINQILKHFPQHSILSEETFSTIQNPESVHNLWIVDPLDGTTNKKFDVPLYAVSLAYCELGSIKIAVIYDPIHEELFWAEENKGAYLNENKIQCQQTPELKGSLVNIGCPYNKEHFYTTYPFGETIFNNGGRVVNLGSAALECAYVACGRLTMYYEAGLKPWDVAAGHLLVKEAGAVMESLDEEFSLFKQQEVFVGNQHIVLKAKELFRTHNTSK